MNLILTPVYKSFDIVKRMCEAIDANTVLPYVHILIDDDSGESLPIPSSEKRRIISLKRDIEGVIHKNGEADAIQLGYDWAHFPYLNEGHTPVWENIFMIESDVIVLEHGWDAKQITISQGLPADWGTLDVISVDEEGKTTYPCTVSPRHDEFTTEVLEWIHYPDWQCTLFNKRVFELGMRFNNAPSHFDVLFGRKMEAFGMKAYRSRELKALHILGGGNSRQFLK